MSRLTDVMALINTETQKCAYDTKRSKPLNGFFVPQRKLEADCELKAREKYAVQLKEAQDEEYTWQNDIRYAFNQEAAEGLDPDIIKILIAALVAVVLIAWMLS